MSDENNVSEETTPSLDDRVSAEDLFSSLDAENALTSHRIEENKPEAKAEDAKAGDEETKVDSQEEEPSKDEDEKPDELSTLKDNFERMEKRFKDNQAAFQKSNQANQKILEKVSKGEELNEEDLKSLVVEAPDSPNEMAKMVADVNEALPIAKAVVSQVSDRDVVEIDKDIDAFNALADVDPTLVRQLVETPINDRAAFVIKRGGELREVFDIVQENGGSVAEAIANSAKISTRQRNKLREEIEAEVKKAYEDKYSDYVSSSVNKPSTRGTAPSKPESPETVDRGDVTAADIFG